MSSFPGADSESNELFITTPTQLPKRRRTAHSSQARNTPSWRQQSSQLSLQSTQNSSQNTNISSPSNLYQASPRTSQNGPSNTPSPRRPPRLQQAHIAAPPFPKCNSYWYKKKLFKLENVQGDYSKLVIRCTQPNCLFKQVNKTRVIGGSGNLIRHYEAHHKSIPITEEGAKALAIQSGPNTVAKDFFVSKGSKDSKLRSLLLNFITKNNLCFRLIDQPDFADLIQYFGKVTLPSRRVLARDLETVFNNSRLIIKERLQNHLQHQGRVSLTTDCWSAHNRKEFMAITVHYIDHDTWKNTNFVLDVIELTEPSHSGEYICNELIKVTDFFDITKAVFTITHDNATANDILVHEFESQVQAKWELMSEEDQARFSLRFTVQKGSIRCSAHIVNLAVQDSKYLLYSYFYFILISLLI